MTCWLLATTLVFLAYDSAAEKAMPNPDLVCGPRCVQMVLSYYGHEEDLMDLVKEIQWPELEKGSRMADLETALRKRGIYTYAMKLNPQARLCWPHPVIMFVRGNGHLGHFVVRTPATTDGMETVWLGMGKSQTIFGGELYDLCDGVILTSREPIGSPDSAVVLSGSFSKVVTSTAVIGIANLAIVSIILLRKHRRKQSLTLSGSEGITVEEAMP